MNHGTRIGTANVRQTYMYVVGFPHSGFHNFVLSLLTCPASRSPPTKHNA